MTPVQRLIKRLEDGFDLDLRDVEFCRTYAGRVQREAGACSWFINRDHEVVTFRGQRWGELVCSYSPVTELLRADRLALVTERHHSTPVVYDAEDAGPEGPDTVHERREGDGR